MQHTTFSEQDMQSFEPAMKIGLLATINENGLPHLTLITSLKAGSPNTVIWGQFTEGMSKKHVLKNPRTGFLIMSLDKEVWRGKAKWSYALKSGSDFDWYNNIPMFRYNAYFGIHTVHYMDLIKHSGKAPLPMNRIVFAAIKTSLARMTAPGKAQHDALNPWSLAFLRKLDNLKFLSYIDRDGYPVILPVIQAQAANTGEILFSTSVFGDEIRAIPAGCEMAMLGMALSMEDVLVRGTYTGLERRGGMQVGSLKVNWVYNSMPPVPGQIYPKSAVQPVSEY